MLGLALAIAKYSRLPPVAWPARVYIEFFRTTPPLVQIVWLYYGLPLLTGTTSVPSPPRRWRSA